MKIGNKSSGSANGIGFEDSGFGLPQTATIEAASLKEELEVLRRNRFSSLVASRDYILSDFQACSEA